jgi:hypothetical protein
MNSTGATKTPRQFIASARNLLTIQGGFSASRDQWDGLVARLGGSFFHSHAYISYDSALPNTHPFFLRVHDSEGECVGIATGAWVSPRAWPWSRYCREVYLGSLPATGDSEPVSQGRVLEAIEEELARRGVFRLRVCSYNSPASEIILSSLGYEVEERYEFYLDLTGPVEKVWQNVRSERRTKIRKAVKCGLATKEENTLKGLKTLWGLHVEALSRRSIRTGDIPQQLDALKRFLIDTGKARLLINYLENQPASAIMFGVFGDQACTFLAGSTAAGNKVGAPAHVYWSMMELLCQEGVPRINIGGTIPKGTEAAKDGLFAFKKDFGATPVRQPAGSKVISKLGKRLSWARTMIKSIIPGTAMA